MENLRTGEKIAGISGIALLIIMFLSWWGAPGDIGDLAAAQGLDIDTTANAWQGADLLDLVWALTAIVAIALAATTVMSSQVNLPVALSAITAGLGILTVVTILYRLLDPPEDAAREFGVFLGLIAALGIAYGGWRAMQDEGTSFTAERDRVSGGTPPPPPPPAPPAPPAA